LGEIGREYEVSKPTVRGWLKHYGLTQNPTSRLMHFAKRPKLERRIEAPDSDELAGLYLLPPEGEGMSLAQLQSYYNVSVPTIRRWLNELGLTQDFGERHSERMSGHSNPAFTNGNSQRYVRRLLGVTREPVCEWCGETKRVQVHHIDHNRENNSTDNLMWLCGSCNRLEAQLYNNERASWQLDEGDEFNTLTIVFNRRGRSIDV